MDLPPIVKIDFAEVNTLFFTMQKRQPFVDLMGFGQNKSITSMDILLMDN